MKSMSTKSVGHPMLVIDRTRHETNSALSRRSFVSVFHDGIDFYLSIDIAVYFIML